MNITTTVGVLEQLLGPVDAIADSCKIKFNQEGINIPATDPMKISMVDISVPRHAFNAYNGDRLVIGIHLDRITKLLSEIESEETAHLKYDSSKNRLELNVNRKSFTLGLVQLDAIDQPPTVPQIRYPAEFTCEYSVLEDTVNTAEIFDNKITFDFSNSEGCVFVHASGDIDKTTVKITRDELMGLETANIENSFSIDILSDIVSVIQSGSEIQVQIDDVKPAKIGYSIVEGEGEVKFQLAPWRGN